jgi:hypothetical protein
MQIQTAVKTDARPVAAQPTVVRSQRRTYAPPRVVSFTMDAESRKTTLSFNGNL